MKFIPYGRHHIDKKDIITVSKALKEELITSGNNVIKFEKKIKDFLKCKFAFTCNSGTSALFLALQSINLKPDDIVIIPSINFRVVAREPEEPATRIGFFGLFSDQESIRVSTVSLNQAS